MRRFGEAFERISRMEWKELRSRVGQEVSKRFDFLTYRLGRTFDSQNPQRCPEDPHFFFRNSDVSRIAAELRRHMPDHCEAILRVAESICRHEFDLLGYEKLSFSDRVDWHFDPVHGRHFPRLIWYKVPYLRVAEAGDSKIVWELNRHQHLVTLARAYCLTKENRFAQEVLAEWDDWQRENPYPIGINWASSLEVAFRAMSWLWVYHLLGGAGWPTEQFKDRLWRSLYVHGRHIEKYLSTYSSPNTHLMGEAVGLFFLGTLCPEFPAAARWRETGWRVTLQEAGRQVLADGMHFEQSTYYHVYAVDFFLHARILASRNGIRIPQAFDDAIKRMLEWLAAVGQNGIVPRFGDDDGGRVFDGQRNRAEHMLDPLSTGAILFNRAEWKAVAGGLREETVWLLGPNAFGDYEKLLCEPGPMRSLALSSSGTYVMAEDGEIRQQLTLDAGCQGVFDSGHGHADALSVNFSVNQREWLVDPGTFCYLSGSEKRDAFRDTSGHNTLQVDGQSQAVPVNAFAWKLLPKTEITSWISRKEFQFFEALHTGYRRFSDWVEHRRVVFHTAPGLWFFLDLAEGQGTHQLDLRWHLGPGIVLKDRATSGWIFSDGDSSEVALLTADATEQSALEHGWYSPVYGKREQALVLRHSKKAALPQAFATLITPVVASSGELGKFQQIREDQMSSLLFGYSYATEDRIHQWAFAGAHQSWRTGSLESDAHFLYCNSTKDGHVERFILCDGMFLRFGGKALFEAREKVPSYEWRSESRRPTAVR
jgi:uncharacterized heparinase superfamily protein